MNVVHLVQDEKFIDFFSRRLGRVSTDTHRYIAHVDDLTLELSFIKETEVYKKVDDRYFSSREMESDLKWAHVLVIHFLTVHAARLILKANSHVQVVWSGWGADYYYLFAGGQESLCGSETKEIVDSIDRARLFSDPFYIARVLLRSFRKYYLLRRIIFPAIKRVDFFSAPLPDDYDLLKKNIGKYFSARYIQLNYVSCKSMSVQKHSSNFSENILVGNSSSPTNNHLEVFNLLRGIDLGNRKIIVPLSYGDPVYREHVIKYGRRILGESFSPVIDFLPLEKYNILVGSCSLAIMNQFRQQALGNICSAIIGGAKLYLNRKSVTFNFLIDRGAIVFPIEDMVAENSKIFCELSSEQKKINESVIESFWGEEIVDNNFKKFISVLSEKHVFNQ